MLSTIKHAINSGKVGHTGTLDKFAEGLMLVLTGKMTRLAPFFSNLDKEYTAVFKFGEETATLDPEGDITARAGIPSLEMIESRINDYTGLILQTPPDFSAIHVNGTRAYKIAAAGLKPDIPPRKVKIDHFTIIDWTSPYLKVNVKCSKGTYIRSLARDLGVACSSRAYVSSLSRTKVGAWKLGDAVDPESFNPDSNMVSGKYLFSKIPDIDTTIVDKLIERKILLGIPIDKWQTHTFTFNHRYTAVFSEDSKFLALLEKNDNKFSYRFVGDSS
ncbi:MAG: tRNA pseudouridine(55) synthase TruB [Spirochaetales bacterium]|nr:tRNA pseudouridine(55) synthase TruB [Spirochaetales bacterium]